MSNNAIELIKKRRTIYALGKNVAQSKEELTELIYTAVKHTPSAFNSQSSRVVVLFAEAHHHLWNVIVKETLRKLVGAEDFSRTDEKINTFAAAFGTVLFFEDEKVINNLQQQFPLYADKFHAFSEQSSGMTQFAVWTTLADQAIGASLQHYNPIIDDEVSEKWQLPEGWLLRAQMPFGSIEAPAGEKSFIDRASRFLVKDN